MATKLDLTQLQIDKAKRTLARLYLDPDWPTPGQIAQVEDLAEDNPVLAAAYSAVRGGHQAVTAVTDPTVFDFLADALNNHRPSKAAAHKHRSKAPADEGLAGDLWPGRSPVMVAQFSHYSGEYPEEPAARTCSTHWYADLNEDGRHTAGRVHYAVLNDFMTNGGKMIKACPHCLHELTVKRCRAVEAISLHYTRRDALFYQETTEDEARKLGAVIRKRRQRGRKQLAALEKLAQERQLTLDEIAQRDRAAVEADLNYAIAYSDEAAVIVHNLAETAAQPLPSDRGALYALFYRWTKNTPKGRRSFHGLLSWAQPADEDATEQKRGKGKEEDQGEQRRRVARLMGEGWGQFATKLSAFLDEPVTRKGITFELPIDEFLAFLKAAGIDYAVIDGELETDVTLNTYKDSDICTKCDTDPPKPHLQASGETPDDLLDAIMGVQK